MAEGFENVYDIANLDDGELRELAYQQFREYPDLNADLVDVQVKDGAVTLTGRVGTEQELQQFESVLTDMMGVARVSNDLVIDELVRGQRPEAADDEAGEEAALDAQLGQGAEHTSDTASHLLPNHEAEMYGTHDPQQAASEGFSYEPPDHPIQQGTLSRENH